MHLQPRPHNWWEFTPKNSTQNKRALLQLRVLGFGLLQDGDVGVGVFPEGEEIFVGSECSDAGSIGVCSLRVFRLQRIRTRHAQMRQRSRPAVPNDAAVVENFLELGISLHALPEPLDMPLRERMLGRDRRYSRPNEIIPNSIVPAAGLQITDRFSRVLSIKRQLGSNRWQPKRLHLRVQREAFPQVLGQGFGSHCIARHRKGKRRFDLDASGLWEQALTPPAADLSRFHRIAVGGFAQSSIRLQYRSIFLAVRLDGGVHSPVGQFPCPAQMAAIRLRVGCERQPKASLQVCPQTTVAASAIAADPPREMPERIDVYSGCESSSFRPAPLDDLPRFVQMLQGSSDIFEIQVWVDYDPAQGCMLGDMHLHGFLILPLFAVHSTQLAVLLAASRG